VNDIVVPNKKILVPRNRPVDVVNNTARADAVSQQAEMQRDMMFMVALGSIAQSIHKHASVTDAHDLQVRMRELVSDLSEDVTNADELLELLLCYCWEKQHNVAAGLLKRHRDNVQKQKEEDKSETT
jgi:hypothetical protein